MQQKALYKFFFFFYFLFWVLFPFFFFKFLGFNFSFLWGELGGFPFFLCFIELEVLWKGRTLSMNCNYTAADGSEPFYVPAPIKNVDK